MLLTMRGLDARPEGSSVSRIFSPLEHLVQKIDRAYTSLQIGSLSKLSNETGYTDRIRGLSSLSGRDAVKRLD